MKNQNVCCPRTEPSYVQHFALDPTNILNALVDVVCVLDARGVFRYLSSSSSLLFGYQPEEMVGVSFTHFIHPDDIQKTIYISTVDRSSHTSHFENRYRRKDGRMIPIIWSGRWDPKDGLLYCVARDGSEKSELKNRLLKAQQIARVANFEFDLVNQTYVYVSDTFYDILGLEKAEHPHWPHP